jgi:hypothetical protein
MLAAATATNATRHIILQSSTPHANFNSEGMNITLPGAPSRLGLCVYGLPRHKLPGLVLLAQLFPRGLFANRVGVPCAAGAYAKPAPGSLTALGIDIAIAGFSALAVRPHSVPHSA